MPATIAANETALLLCPVSNMLIVRIRNRAIRPAPVWRVMSSAGVADPVRMNWPSAPRSSTCRRIAFHTCGTTCHSSSRRGVGPLKINVGSICAAARANWSTSSITTLPACCREVSVLPHAFGPSTSTAPEDRRRSVSSASVTRAR